MRLDESFPVVILKVSYDQISGGKHPKYWKSFFSVFEKMFLSFKGIKLWRGNEGGFQDGFQEAFIGTWYDP